MLFDVRFPGQLQNGVTRGAQHHDFSGLLTGSTERAPASTEPLVCAQRRTDMRARLFEELRWHTARRLVSARR